MFKKKGSSKTFLVTIIILTFLFVLGTYTLKNSETNADVITGYVLASAGADGVFGTNDDLYTTERQKVVKGKLPADMAEALLTGGVTSAKPKTQKQRQEGPRLPEIDKPAVQNQVLVFIQQELQNITTTTTIDWDTIRQDVLANIHDIKDVEWFNAQSSYSQEGWHDVSFKLTFADDTKSDELIVRFDVFPTGWIAIKDASDLAKIGKDPNYPLNGNYYMTADIDLSGINWVPINNFAGKFNGNFHTISNLYVNGSYKDAGLFGYISSCGEIKNVVIKNASIKTTYNSYPYGCIGILVGSVEKGTKLSNIYVQGNLYNYGKGHTGGVVGWAKENTLIENSYAKVYIEQPILENWRGLGLFAGYVGYGTVINCYAEGTIKEKVTLIGAYSGVGGICGYINGTTIKNCYTESTLPIYKCTHAGGNNIISSYNGQNNLSDKTLYATWDFDNIWVYKDNTAPPVLKWIYELGLQ